MPQKRTSRWIDDDNDSSRDDSDSSQWIDGDYDPIGDISSRPSASSKGKGKAVKTDIQGPKQLTIKEKWHDTDMAIAMWFYDAGIPFSAVNSPYFQAAVDKIVSMGHGYKAPPYHALRVNLLRDAKTQVTLLVDSLRQHWTECGCTIMVDGWIDSSQRQLINFLVYCSRGLSFIKSVDASNILTDAENLCNLFGEIVEIVGPNNVVHVVTDNGANYKAAGKKLSEKYPTIQWSPCVVQCINLIIKDIAEMPKVRDIAFLASRITLFVYNHKSVLNWLRKRSGWREIVRPGATRFATTFIALKSLHDQKHDLQALVVSDEFKKYMRMPRGAAVRQIVLDELFWSRSLIFVKIVTPMLRLLRICGSGEKPTIGYVYEGMYRARNDIKELFKSKKSLYKPYTSIIKKRWDRMLRQNLHAAAYWLNPVFQYDKTNLCQKPEVMKAVMNIIDNQKLYSKQKLVKETQKFQQRLGGFSRDLAIDNCKSLRPDQWWSLFGYEVQNLQKLAVRILSQTASSSGCERNWGVFERLHTKKRNKLEHQRLNDLVYIHYNLGLQNRSTIEKKTLDPIDYESIDKTEFWICEDEHEKELDMDELENMLEEHPRLDDSSTSVSKVNEDDDDDGYGNDDDDDDNEDDYGNENDEDY
ncbi:uncharacterized protein [Euphorbia lathyris]|uniref:uncharacterized protein n=1 Tax=Euphorbia lathyris TaxID=212925 RepID=UPI00331392B4